MRGRISLHGFVIGLAVVIALSAYLFRLPPSGPDLGDVVYVATSIESGRCVTLFKKGSKMRDELNVRSKARAWVKSNADLGGWTPTFFDFLGGTEIQCEHATFRILPKHVVINCGRQLYRPVNGLDKEFVAELNKILDSQRAETNKVQSSREAGDGPE
jgi:hypothetical protein